MRIWKVKPSRPEGPWRLVKLIHTRSLDLYDKARRAEVHWVDPNSIYHSTGATMNKVNVTLIKSVVRVKNWGPRNCMWFGGS